MTTEERKKTKKKRIKILLVLAIFLFAGSLAASRFLKCNVEDYTTTVQPLLEEWDDAVNVANQTPRMSLSNMIPILQEIKRRTTDLKIDECFVDAHSFLIEYMECTIEGFLAFMGQENDSAVQAKFSRAKTYFEAYLLHLAH